MRKRFLIVIYALLLLGAWPAQAQDELRISNLEISLWPEYDRPEVLVIYRGGLAADISLPVPVEIRIPSSVGQPFVVAYVDEDGQQFNQQYVTRVEGDWLVVSFELNTPRFQLEYYDTLPVDTEDRREYTLNYVADYAVDALNLEFQVPPTARDFALEPPADSVVVENDGLTYHLVEASAYEQGEEGSRALSYVKPDSNLTRSGSPEAPVPAESTASTSPDNSTALIFLLAFVIVVAVGAGAFWLGRRTEIGAEPVPSTSRRHKRRGSGRGSPSQSGGGRALFCHQCGADLRPDSDFCHKCGTEVRER